MIFSPFRLGRCFLVRANPPLKGRWGFSFSSSVSGPSNAKDSLSCGPTGLSSDSGLGGSSDGSSDVLAFGTGSVVDSVTEEGGCVPLCLHIAYHPNTLEGFSFLTLTLPQRVLSPRSPAVR